MSRTSLSLAAGLAATLLLASAPAAQAAVTAKDAPSKSDIVKAFPALDGGTFSTDKYKAIGVPGPDCGETSTQKASSVVTSTGVSADGLSVVVGGVSELKSRARTKAYLAGYKKYVKACESYTDPTTGATVTMQLKKAPALGEGALAVVGQTSFSGVTSYSATVLIRDGKRLATVVSVDDAQVPTSSINKLAKVTAKKMK
jgi:hypothetical protein